MKPLPKLLLIEDSVHIGQALSLALHDQYDLDIAYTGKQGLYRTDYQAYDAVLLDLGLPDMSGAAVCQELRERGYMAPILILSAESRALVKIELLDLGANDFITKPFSLGELKARLRLQLRGHRRASQLGTLRCDSITIDLAARQARRDGHPLNLRKKEFDLLACLMIHQGSTVTRQTLIDYAWHGHDTPWANTLDVHIKHLRDKIDKPFGSDYIRTVHGVGYRLEPQPALVAAAY